MTIHIKLCVIVRDIPNIFINSGFTIMHGISNNSTK